MQLGVCLVDLDRLPVSAKQKILGGKLDLEIQQIKLEGRVIKDEPVLVFNCDLLEAALACDLLRSYDRKARYEPTRLYIRPAVNWSRIKDDTVLTVVVDGRAHLNPLVFSGVVLPIVDKSIEPVKPFSFKRIGK